MQNHKIIFIGDQAVGKTTIINRQIYDHTDPEYQPTIGIDFFSKSINNNIRFQIWDTSGAEKFRTMISTYLRTSSIIVIMYDITSRSSFTHLNEWLQLASDTNKSSILFIIGNKNDLEDQRAVSIEEGQQFSQQHNAHFFETNKLNDDFFTRIQNIIENQDISKDKNTNDSVNLNNKDKHENTNDSKNLNNKDKHENTNDAENLNEKKYLISASGLKNIFFINNKNEIISSFEIENNEKTELKDDDFCFIIGKYKVITNRYLADFISPKVSHLHHLDITINTVCLNDFIDNDKINAKEIFDSELIENFKKIATGKEINVDFKMSRKLCFLGNLLGNEEISLKMKELFRFDFKNLKIEECLTMLKLGTNFYEIDQNELIDFVSSKFYSIEQSQLLDLPKSILYSILSNGNLMLNSEDSLIDFINEIFSHSEKNKNDDDSITKTFFYELIEFRALSEDKICEFINSIDHNNFTDILWNRFKELFNKDFTNQEKIFNKRYHKS